MIIEIINVHYILTRKAKDHSPVCANGNRPKALQLPFQRMKPKTRQVHISNPVRNVKARENIAELLRVIPDHAPRIIIVV